jgi:glycosyltransferase 2 family protein
MPRVALPRWALRTVQFAVTIGLLALLWTVADGPQAAAKLAAADPRWLVVALAALTLQTILSAVRWRLTAAQFGIALPLREALREYYMSQVVNQSLPGGMVGDAARAVRARGQAGLLAAGQSVVFERLAGQIALFLAMTGAFVATVAAPGGLEWPSWLLPPVATFIFVGLAVPLAAAAAVWLPGRIGQGVLAGWRAFDTAISARRVLPRQAALSIATTLCNLAAFACCAFAVGADLSLVAILALVPLILFTMLIPISVAGWGLREGAAAALFPVAGASATQGLAASIAFGLVFLVAVLPGVPLVLLQVRMRAAKSRGG